MNIAVCVKEVPDSETRPKIHEDGKNIKREEIKWIVNPYDEFAIEEALQITEKKFYKWIAPMRDSDLWEKDKKGNWIPNDTIGNHVGDVGVAAARIPLVAPEDRTFGSNNFGFYWREDLSFNNTTEETRDCSTNRDDFIIL